VKTTTTTTTSLNQSVWPHRFKIHRSLYILYVSMPKHIFLLKKGHF